MKKYIISYMYRSKTEKGNGQYIGEAENVYDAIEFATELVNEWARNKGQEQIENPIVITSVYSEETGVEAEITKYRATLVLVIMFFCISMNISNDVFIGIINAIFMLWFLYYLYKS